MRLFALALIAVFLAACSSASENAADTRNDIEIQIVLPSSLLNQIGSNTLQMEMTLGTDSPQLMQVDTAAKTAKINIDNSAGGEKNIVVKGFTPVSGSTLVQIFQLNATVIITQQSTQTLDLGSYLYNDDDGDGFTNLAEIVAETDWIDLGQRPNGKLPRYSTNYLIYDDVTIPVNQREVQSAQVNVQNNSNGKLANGSSSTSKYNLY